MVVAALPLHIRFSHSEVAFAPSIALSSLAFALAHGALKERARAWRWFAWIALPPLAFLAYSARPLNILFAPLLIATCLFLTPATVRPQRRWGVAALVAAPAPLSIWYNLRVYFGAEYASSAAPIELLRSTARAFFSFEYNTLIRPDITPPLLLIAGVIGSVWAWRAGRRRIVGFLVAWLTLFFATHTVAMGEIYMQARYHMHLVAPLALIATLGFDELLTRRSSIGIGALALVAISPVAHGSFIRDVDFDEQREYAFVRQARPLIPPGCTVLEFSGPGAEVLQHRFERFGMQIVDGERTRRFEVVEIGAPTGSDDPLLPEARALLLDPPECLVYFQGLECWSAKEPEESIAPACAAAVDAAPVALVEEVRFPTRIYNYSISLGYGPTLDELHLALYRVTAPPPQSRAD